MQNRFAGVDTNVRILTLKKVFNWNIKTKFLSFKAN